MFKFVVAPMLLILISLNAFALENGTYTCVKGNNDSVCPQIIQAQVEGSELVGLRVYYSGYCNDQGPFYYVCLDGNCGDGAIEFTNIKATSYHWQNHSHGIYCDFKLAP